MSGCGTRGSYVVFAKMGARGVESQESPKRIVVELGSDAGGIAFEPTSTGSGGTEALVFTATPRGFLRITVMMSSW